MTDKLRFSRDVLEFRDPRPGEVKESKEPSPIQSWRMRIVGEGRDGVYDVFVDLDDVVSINFSIDDASVRILINNKRYSLRAYTRVEGSSQIVGLRPAILHRLCPGVALNCPWQSEHESQVSLDDLGIIEAQLVR